MFNTALDFMISIAWMFHLAAVLCLLVVAILCVFEFIVKPWVVNVSKELQAEVNRLGRVQKMLDASLSKLTSCSDVTDICVKELYDFWRHTQCAVEDLERKGKTMKNGRKDCGCGKVYLSIIVDGRNFLYGGCEYIKTTESNGGVVFVTRLEDGQLDRLDYCTRVTPVALKYVDDC